MTYNNGIDYNRQRELSNCNFIKTVLMILVVFYHSIVFWRGDWFTANPRREAVSLSVFAQWLDSFHIYAFVLVSGYIFFHLKHEKGKYQKFFPFLVNKIKRLIVPYVFLAVAWVIPIQWYFLRYDWITILKNFAFALNPNQLWFLIMLFDIFVVFWWFSDFFAKHHVIGSAVVLVVYLIGVLGPHFIPNVFMIWRAMTYIPLFWLGFKLRQCGTSYLNKIPWWTWVIVDVLVFIITKYIVDPEASLISKLINYGLNLALHCIGSLMAFIVLQKIADHINTETRVLKFFSRRSMPIYLFHQQIIYFIIVLLNGLVHPYVNAICNFAVALVASVVMSELLMRFKSTKFLIGEK